MLLPRRVPGRTLGLHGPDLARGPEVARLCLRWTGAESVKFVVPIFQDNDMYIIQNVLGLREPCESKDLMAPHLN